MTAPLATARQPVGAQAWAAYIAAALSESVKGIIEVGRRLIEAKAALPHGEWLAMLGCEPLRIKRSMAQALMKIARDSRITNNVGFLPPSWGTLVEISRLADADFDRKIADGSINPAMRRTDITAENHRLARAVDEQRVLNLAPKVGKFRTLVIDPPWAYDDEMLGRGGVPYATMPRDQVLALPVPAWAEDECHLYLWTTNAILPLAVECMKAWGFQHKSMLTWAKPSYGMGTQFRGQTEHVLFGIKGKLSTRCTDISTLFEAPRGAHSEKPEKFYDIVRAASYPPYGEAFQRQARPGFVNLYEQITEARAA
jgi:N6-adenosine-specific RNA methylase IME4